jgi:P2-related tail formation protein
MENEYNTIFDKGTFSRAIKVKSNDFEENIYKELSQLLNIRN